MDLHLYPEFKAALPGVELLTKISFDVHYRSRSQTLFGRLSSQLGTEYIQLADIQFRLSEITQPLDLFLHRTLRQGPPSCEAVIEFVNVVHELLVDTASRINQQCVNSMYRHTQGRGQTPCVAPTSSVSPLLDPKKLVDHVS
ncbi:hypothetical protein O0I10_011602 [Lichtheimia ornata]|uniref:Uncharacterized protein n=1 Tax=Lichtheimia ornata TaxID=688661 RepID=A0AAD7UT43_9FUNG|nr:uncharacterized protein O0I10_011602 [Lichtheimia ornata]KAJ8652720.1 hypothetical protein O0I10_011602 [Lichtheimia ornata]